MAYVNRPYGGTYYEADRTVIRDAPYGGAYRAADYGVDEYGNRIHQHRDVVTEVVTDVIPGDYHHHHHYGGPAEIIERREERIVDGAYDPYRRIY